MNRREPEERSVYRRNGEKADNSIHNWALELNANWFWPGSTHLWAAAGVRWWERKRGMDDRELDRSWTQVKMPCRDMLPYPHRAQHRSAGSEITPGTQLPPPHLFVPALARNQEWNYFSMWFHTKIKSIYTSLLTTWHRHGIADFRTVPLTIDWAFPCQSIKTTPPPPPTPYMPIGYPALAKPSGDLRGCSRSS